MGCWCIGEELVTVIWTLKTSLSGHVKNFLQGWALLPVLLQVLGHLVHLGPQAIPEKTKGNVKDVKETAPFFSWAEGDVSPSSHWDTKGCFSQGLWLHRLLPLLGASPRTRAVQNTNEVAKFTIYLGHITSKALNKTGTTSLSAMFCIANSVALCSATKAQSYKLSA